MQIKALLGIVLIGGLYSNSATQAEQPPQIRDSGYGSALKQPLPTQPSSSGFSERPLSEIVPPPGNLPPHTNGVVSFKLKPTAIAPVGAAGSAQLKERTIKLHLTSLGPGRYQLEAVRRAEAYAHLGVVTIGDPTASPDRQATDNKKEASAGPDQVRIDTDVQITLPPGVAASNIDQLALQDSGGNNVLEGKAE